jgi:hypothetical protein
MYFVHVPPLWSSGQSSWLQIRRPGFDSRHYQKKKNSGSGTGSTQPCEYNWGATWQKSSGSCLENRENTAGGIRHADHVAPSIRTSWQSLHRQAAVARYSSLTDSDHGVFFFLDLWLWMLLQWNQVKAYFFKRLCLCTFWALTTVR